MQMTNFAEISGWTMFYFQEIKPLTSQKLAKVKLCESSQKNRALVTGRGKETKL
jgi:hypothetical protein